MRRERKTKIKIKIHLIYELKLKSCVIGRDIRRKTQILTEDSAWIDPIACQIKWILFREYKDDRWHSRINFSLFSQGISLSNTPWTQKLIYKQRKARDLRIEMFKQFDYLKHPKLLYIVEEHVNL